MTATPPLLVTLKPNPHWALPLVNRKNWSRVRFGDVVENVYDTESNPAEAGLNRFIGLEHLEPGSLHIRAWGNVVDGTTFTRRCRPGQVLFAKHPGYHGKLAVPEFDAAVSGDVYVLVPKGDRLLPGLLPFLGHSEQFFQHAVGTSAGSLSPQTNWSSLASFEFDLPPLDQQRRIAEILSAMDAVEIADMRLKQSGDVLRKTKLRETFTAHNKHSRMLVKDASAVQLVVSERRSIGRARSPSHISASRTSWTITSIIPTCFPRISTSVTSRSSNPHQETSC